MDSRTQPSFRPMQDIVPPKSATTSPAPAANNLPAAAAPQPTVAAPVDTPSPPASAETPEALVEQAAAPATTAPVQEVTPTAPEPVQSAPLVPSAPTAPAAPPQVHEDADAELDHIMNEVNNPEPEPVHTDQPQEIPSHHQQKSHRPIIIGVVAIVIAILLAVVAVVAFRNTKQTSSTDSATTASTAGNGSVPLSTAGTQTAVTTGDVKTIGQTIDNNFGSLNDDQDYGATDVNDQALGLL